LAVDVGQDLGQRGAQVLWDAVPGRLTPMNLPRCGFVGHDRLEVAIPDDLRADDCSLA